MRRFHPALTLTLLYAAAGAVWILVSDVVLGLVAPTFEWYLRFQTYKGWLFILATSVLLYLVSRWDHDRRKKLEVALKQSEMSYRRIVDGVREGILVLDAGDVVEFVNGHMASMLSRSPAEIVGRRFTEFLAPDSVPLAEWGLVGGVRSDGNRLELSLLRKDGGTVRTQVSLTTMTDEGGRLVGSLALVSDISARKEADRKIQESLEEKEALLREIHHRVKNNLQIISSLFSLQSGYLLNEEDRRLFQNSEFRIGSMALIHEILYTSGSFTKISLREYLDELMPMLFSSHLGDTGRIRFRVDAEEVSVALDVAIPCGLIINELVMNSLRHAFPPDAKGEVRVVIRKRGGFVCVTVSDTGVGFSPGSVDRGGLGFTMVSLLVQQLKGRLSCSSGGGTSVSFHFPVRPEEPA